MANIITKTFTYDIADDYLAQTNDLGKTAEWTYEGPDKVWVFISKESLHYVGRFLTEDNDGETYPTPIDQYKVLIDCNVDPLIAVLVGAGKGVDIDALEQHTEELPDGTTYTRIKNPTPDHTYELNEIIYNPTTGEFNKPYPWKKPHIAWEQIRAWRNSLLENSDDKELSDMPESLRSAWAEYRQKLRDLPQVHGAAHSGEEPVTEPWKIQPYKDPNGRE